MIYITEDKIGVSSSRLLAAFVVRRPAELVYAEVIRPVTRAAAVGDEHPVLPLSISYNGYQNSLKKKSQWYLRPAICADRNEMAGGRAKKKRFVVM